MCLADLIKVAKGVAKSYGSDDEFESIAYYVLGTRYAETEHMEIPRRIAYLRQCVSNAIIDHLRRENVRRHEGIEDKADDDRSIDLYISLREVLTPIAVTVLELRAYHLLTFEEIAGKLNISLSAVLSIMRDIRNVTRKIQG